MSGIYGKPAGYGRQVVEHQHAHIDWDDPSQPKPRRNRIVRLDLPPEIYEHFEKLADAEETTVNLFIMRELRRLSDVK